MRGCLWFEFLSHTLPMVGRLGMSECEDASGWNL